MNTANAVADLKWYTALLMVFILSGCSFTSKTSGRLLKESAKTPYEIIVVPGVPFEKGQWSQVMKARVYWAKYLYDKGITKNIMFSGAAVYSPYYEGKIMALYAEAIGIPRENIYSETRAEHSTENIYYSWKKARKLGFTRIALASDPFQTKMLGKFTRKKLSADIGLIPFITDTLKSIEPNMTDPIIDYQQAFEKDFVPLTKRQGFWKRFRGTMGKNVDVKAYD
jgi:uncharacterized SAM-binding protein YcdF (DUF218 family)